MPLQDTKPTGGPNPPQVRQTKSARHRALFAGVSIGAMQALVKCGERGCGVFALVFVLAPDFDTNLCLILRRVVPYSHRRKGDRDQMLYLANYRTLGTKKYLSGQSRCTHFETGQRRNFG